MPDAAAVDMLISNLTMITSFEARENLPHFPSDLNATNAVVTMVVNFLLQSEEIMTINEVSISDNNMHFEPQSITQGVFDVFNNMLETVNECSWEQLQMVPVYCIVKKSFKMVLLITGRRSFRKHCAVTEYRKLCSIYQPCS